MEYETDNDKQPKTNEGLELHTDMVGNKQNNINPTPHQSNQMVASSMQVPFDFTDHQHRDNVRGGFTNLPNYNTIHNFEGIQTNFTMERHPGTYGDGLRGQLGTAQRYFGPNRQQPGGSMEVNLMGHHNPLVLANLGAVPKTFSQGSTPRTRLSNVSCYTNLDEDPIEAQRQIMAHCVAQNIKPRDPARGVVMEDHTSPTKVHIEQPRGIYRESAQMDPGHGANRSQEQIDCIQSMSEEQG